MMVAIHSLATPTLQVAGFPVLCGGSRTDAWHDGHVWNAT